MLGKKYYTVAKLEMRLDLWIVAPPGILYMMLFFCRVLILLLTYKSQAFQSLKLTSMGISVTLFHLLHPVQAVPHVAIKI